MAATLALAASGQSAHAQTHPHIQPSYYEFSVMSRSAVFGPFLQQARNGQVVDQTIWNYHFPENKADLLSPAHYLLDRLVRRQSGDLLEVHLQTARDLAYSQENFQKLAKFREQLDRQRVKAIVDYMTANHGHITFIVRVIDPAPVGMGGDEAARFYRQATAMDRPWILPPELLGGLGRYLERGAPEAPPAEQIHGSSPTGASLGVEATRDAAPPPMPEP